MPWCPVCESEYVEGYTHCKKCDVDLVDSLENIPEPFIFDEKEPPEDVPQTEEASSLEVAEAYVDKFQKAEEYKSSAMALLLVGGAGLIILIALLLDLLPIHIYGMSKVITGIVMGAMFAGFLVAGVHSLKLQKKYLIIADEENELMEEMLLSLKDGYSPEQIDAVWKVGEEDFRIDVAQMYYKRVEVIKTALKDKFPEVDQSLVEKIADDWYSQQFDDKETEESE